MLPNRPSLIRAVVKDLLQCETKVSAAKLRQRVAEAANAANANGVSSAGASGATLRRSASHWNNNHHNGSRILEDTFTKPEEFNPRRALILTKVSRYEFEKKRYLGHTESELAEALASRGSDYSMMRKHHQIHEDNERRLVRSLEDRGVETRVVKRGDYTDQNIKWADIIFTAGGDGTYLMAASKILNDQKPVVGINTDATRSEGYLCLPRHYSDNVDEAIEQILSGAFYWFLRKRLRLTLIGDREQVLEPAIELHSQQLQYPEYRFFELVNESNQTGDHPLIENYSNGVSTSLSKRVLPILALNEIFVGESLSSRVSYLEVKLDKADWVKTRNSGLCISTGTGSTSWTFNINKLTQQSVEKILKIAHETTKFPINWKDPRLVEAVTMKFNNDIVFDPERNMMAYTLRDPVTAGIFPGATEKRPRGKANKIEVKSRCFDACLVIDGSLSFKFNDGMRCIVEIDDDDALRTMQLYSGVH